MFFTSSPSEALSSITAAGIFFCSTVGKVVKLSSQIEEFSVFRKSEIHKAFHHFGQTDTPAVSLVPVFYLLVHFHELYIS